MKIGFNHTSTIGTSGNSTYARELIYNLAKIDKENQYFLYLTSSKKSTLPVARAGWTYKYIWPKKFSTQLSVRQKREKLTANWRLSFNFCSNWVYWF